MLRLRELAGAAAVGIVAMSAAMALPFVSTIHVAFKPEIAMRAVRVAANGAFGLGGGNGQPTIVAPPLPRPEDDAADRLKRKIPANLYPYFDVFLYVSKAADGSLAQHLYMFHKDDAGGLVFEQSFPVSTGRERHEKYFTSTPTGLFELDPGRFERMHYSHTWNGAAMPYAMFLDATIKGRQTGVALHSASTHTADLGHRASGGCVRLPPEKAAELFERFAASEHGMVPVFAYDSAHRRTDEGGRLLRGEDGKPILVPGYRVLVFIEDYDGNGPALVAVIA